MSTALRHRRSMPRSMWRCRCQSGKGAEAEYELSPPPAMSSITSTLKTSICEEKTKIRCRHEAIFDLSSSNQPSFALFRPFPVSFVSFPCMKGLVNLAKDEKAHLTAKIGHNGSDDEMSIAYVVRREKT